MRVHGGMPVEAAEEHRMHDARRRETVVASEQVLGVIRVLARDVGERAANELCRELGSQRCRQRAHSE